MKSYSTRLFASIVVLITFAALGSSPASAYQPVAALLSAPANGNSSSSQGNADTRGNLQDGTDLSSSGDAPGTVTELKQMVKSGQLTELRVTYNGPYGAALFFYPQEMVYYVALFQDKNFWRVVKSQDDVQAETVYTQFARKSYALADTEIKRTQLQAQRALLERVIAVSADRAQRLTTDLSIARAQESEVSQRQQQMQIESNALLNDKAAAERKLRALQQQVQQLQDQSEAAIVQ